MDRLAIPSPHDGVDKNGRRGSSHSFCFGISPWIPSVPLAPEPTKKDPKHEQFQVYNIPDRMVAPVIQLSMELYSVGDAASRPQRRSDHQVLGNILRC
jgi:hypothetical protein